MKYPQMKLTNTQFEKDWQNIYHKVLDLLTDDSNDTDDELASKIADALGRPSLLYRVMDKMDYLNQSNKWMHFTKEEIAS